MGGFPSGATRVLICGVTLAGVLACPAAALGQDAPRTDPGAGSPAEAVYGIPLEEARRDAAPNAVPSSVTRTEMGVGSSEEVPGQRSRRPEGGPPPESRRVQRRRLERRGEAAEAASRISGNPSPVATGLLLVLAVAIAGGGGALTGRLVGRRAKL